MSAGKVRRAVLAGVPGGYPILDAGSKVPTSYLPTNVANGLVLLDSGVLVPIGFLPVGTGASQVAAGNHSHGASGALIFIAETVLGADAATITITGIPSTYKDLVVQCKVRTAVAAVVDDIEIRVGSGSVDSTAGHYAYYFNYQGTSSGTTGSGSASFGYAYVGPGNTAAAGIFGAGEIIIPDYASTSEPKQMLIRGAYAEITNTHYYAWGGSFWNQTTAIDRVQIGAFGSAANLKAGSRVAVYGRG